MGTVLLRLAPALASSEVSPVEWTPAALNLGLPEFYTDCVDSLLLLLLRLFLTAILAIAAVHFGSPRLDDLAESDAPVTEPLLLNATAATCPPCTTTSTMRAAPRSEVREEHLESFRRKQSASLRKNL